MTDRNAFAPEERDPDFDLYDAAPPDMPPSPAGADVEAGGEAASSRRNAGLPRHLARDPDRAPGLATPGAEPILGYDGLRTDDLLAWIEEADPGIRQLRAILDYERTHRGRESIIETCAERLRALGGEPES
ncbi:MAG TPA: hypothetical protein VF158_13360 [Longimicrobiales bacterium]